MSSVPRPMRLPAYAHPGAGRGATPVEGSVHELIPALVAGAPMPALEPRAAAARRSVVLVVDGLGWNQLAAHRTIAPTLAGAAGGPITTVAPSTTATALTSIATGTTPGEHGVVGYRIDTHAGLMNALRWRTPEGDARSSVVPEDFQPTDPFLASPAAVVVNAEFHNGGFSRAHLRNTDWFGVYTPFSIVAQVAAALEAHRFVYAYYDGLDKIAHAHGVDSDHYRDELGGVDRLVMALRERLDDDTALVVTADHGLVDVGDRVVDLGSEVVGLSARYSGEARFLWCHAKAGRAADLVAAAEASHGADAWVVTIDQVLDERWFGPLVTSEARDRLGDVAIIAHEPIAILEPGSPDTSWLRGRHGSLTDDEMLVPLLSV